jgi:hypothetical protein
MRPNVCVNHRTARLELECRLDTRLARRHHPDTPSPNTLTLVITSCIIRKISVARSSSPPLCQSSERLH